MENAKKPNYFLVVFLLLTVLGITAINIYQDRVIEKQRYELRWLLTHSTIRPDVDVALAAKNVADAKASAATGQTQAANVASAPSSVPSAKP